MPKNTKQKEGIESRRVAGEHVIKRKRSNLGAMLENTNQNKWIESGRDTGEPEIKKEAIESRSNAREPKTKGRDRIFPECHRIQNKRKGSNLSQCQRTRMKTKGSNQGVMPENSK